VSLWLIRLRLRLVAGFGWLGRSMAQWPRWAWFLPGVVQALVVFLVVLLAHPGDWGGALTSGVSALVIFTLLWGLLGPRASAPSVAVGSASTQTSRLPEHPRSRGVLHR